MHYLAAVCNITFYLLFVFRQNYFAQNVVVIHQIVADIHVPFTMNSSNFGDFCLVPWWWSCRWQGCETSDHSLSLCFSICWSETPLDSFKGVILYVTGMATCWTYIPNKQRQKISWVVSASNCGTFMTAATLSLLAVSYYSINCVIILNYACLWQTTLIKWFMFINITVTLRFKH